MPHIQLFAVEVVAFEHVPKETNKYPTTIVSKIKIKVLEQIEK